LANETRTWDAASLVHALQKAGVPSGMVHSNKDLFEDPQLAYRGHFIFYEKAKIGRHPVQRSEFRLSRAQALRNWPSPFVGEHARGVCRGILGRTDAETEPLIAQGVLETADDSAYARCPSGPRSSRPGSAPVCCPSRSRTSPFTTVALTPRARCTSR